MEKVIKKGRGELRLTNTIREVGNDELKQNVYTYNVFKALIYMRVYLVFNGHETTFVFYNIAIPKFKK